LVGQRRRDEIVSWHAIVERLRSLVEIVDAERSIVHIMQPHPLLNYSNYYVLIVEQLVGLLTPLAHRVQGRLLKMGLEHFIGADGVEKVELMENFMHKSLSLVGDIAKHFLREGRGYIVSK
jgi:hypothetical protein